MLIKRKSTITGIEREIDLPVTQEQLNNWNNGMLIQQAMPNLTASQREFIITGITDEEWDEYIKNEEESEEAQHNG